MIFPPTILILSLSVPKNGKRLSQILVSPPPPQLVHLWQQWYMEFQFLTPMHNSNANKPYLWLHFTILRLIVMCIWPLSHVFCFIILLCLMPDDLNSDLGDSAATQWINQTIIRLSLSRDRPYIYAYDCVTFNEIYFKCCTKLNSKSLKICGPHKKTHS